ncbi:MAG: hypothetical protein ABL895_18685 [Cyclobacteriaceae bacterium]
MKQLATGLFQILTLQLLLSSCETSFQESSSCAAPFKGRIVSTSVPCAGIAIQVLTEGVSSNHVDLEWTDSLGNGTVYTNVFKVYECDVENDIGGYFTYNPDLQTFGTREFYFRFKNDSLLTNEHSGCSICKVNVSLPTKRNKIYLDVGCRDLIEIVD